MQSNVNKLSDDLMDDLDDLRAGHLNPSIATQICRYANTVIKAENIKLQYIRVDERVKRKI